MDCTWSTFNHTLAVTHLLSTLRCKNEYIEWCIIFPSFNNLLKKTTAISGRMFVCEGRKGNNLKATQHSLGGTSNVHPWPLRSKSIRTPGSTTMMIYQVCNIGDWRKKLKKKLPKCEGRLWAREVNKKKPAGNPHLHVIQDARRRLLHPQH